MVATNGLDAQHPDDSPDSEQPEAGPQPSATRQGDWISVDGPNPDQASDWTGKWLLYLSPDVVDKAWATIKAATRSGKLGFLSKVADRRLAENGPQAGRNPYGHPASIEHPCCIYTRDCRDSADVARVLGTLRQLGFTGWLTYKEDTATHIGLYGKGAALYSSRPDSLEFRRHRRPVDPAVAYRWDVHRQLAAAGQAVATAAAAADDAVTVLAAAYNALCLLEAVCRSLPDLGLTGHPSSSTPARDAATSARTTLASAPSLPSAELPPVRIDWSKMNAVAGAVAACARTVITALERGAGGAAAADQRAMREAALKVRALEAAPLATAEPLSP
jgi:Domain of unknown function (DUF1917)